MVGISSEQIIAEAYLKGCRGFDPERAFTALKATAMSDLRGLDYVQKLQPIPSDVMKNRPVAQALEFAIGDASIAQMAKALGKTSDYEYFKKRAASYKMYFDANSGFFRGKMTDGSWNPVFDPLKSTRPWAADYAEGNAWQYLWLVPQDVPGLIALLGGEQKFNDVLAGSQYFFCGAPDDHALRDRGGAGGFQFGAKADLGGAILIQNWLAGGAVNSRPADIYQAHAAHAHRFHLGMVAKDGDGDANHLGGIHHQGPGRNTDRTPVYGE